VVLINEEIDCCGYIQGIEPGWIFSMNFSFLCGKDYGIKCWWFNTSRFKTK
jgi:hypothetical protein